MSLTKSYLSVISSIGRAYLFENSVVGSIPASCNRLVTFNYWVIDEVGESGLTVIMELTISKIRFQDNKRNIDEFEFHTLNNPVH